MGRLQAAEAAYRTALSDTSPSDTSQNANALNNLGMVLLEQGRVEEAERALREAVRSCPDAADARLNLAMAALLNGAFDEGWKLYEARWQVDPTLSATRDIPAPRWTGKEPVAGKTVLLHAEQGFGDTLQFCRYAPLVANMGAPQPVNATITSGT